MAHSVQLLQDVLDSSHLERDLIGVLVGGVTNARVFDVREGLRGQPAVLVTVGATVCWTVKQSILSLCSINVSH